MTLCHHVDVMSMSPLLVSLVLLWCGGLLVVGYLFFVTAVGGGLHVSVAAAVLSRTERQQNVGRTTEAVGGVHTSTVRCLSLEESRRQVNGERCLHVPLRF